MFHFKVLLVSLLVMLVVTFAASTVASATLNGPWWRHPEGGKQVKWKLNEEHEVKAINEGTFQLKARIGGTPFVFNCSLVTSKGSIWNGLQQGEGKIKIFLEECAVSEPCPTTIVVLAPIEMYSELMWKYKGDDKKELGEAGQQKIYEALAPAEEQKEGKAILTTFTLKGSGLCTGAFLLKAGGTIANFTDQEDVMHKIVWGTAALVEPQNRDAVTGHLSWLDPNQTKLHHQETPTEAKLTFGGERVELQGRMKVESNTLEEFGAFNE